MKRRLEPNDCTRSATAFCAPLPIAITVITAATPMMIPNIVSAPRILLADRDETAILMLSMSSVYNFFICIRIFKNPQSVNI